MPPSEVQRTELSVDEAASFADSAIAAEAFVTTLAATDEAREEWVTEHLDAISTRESHLKVGQRQEIVRCTHCEIKTADA